MTYKLTANGVLRLADKAHVPAEPLNGDWQTYTAWLEAGGVPLPDDPAPVPSYKDLRLSEYPQMTDFLDGMVKITSTDPTVSEEGNAQVAAYYAACLAVKAKYPK